MIRTENKDLYPTPSEVVELMIKKVSPNNGDRILEPSAGTGNILRKLMNPYSYNKYEVDVIEPEKELQSNLKELGGRLVSEDFLTYNTFTVYDSIIMNPPFSEGDKHLLKAISMMRSGGKICCLLNSETLENPFSVYRKDLLRKLDELNAEITDLGQCFKDSERTTDVNISMVYIDIPKSESDIMEHFKKEKELEFEYNENTEITDRRLDVFSGLVEQYELEMNSVLKLIDEYYKIVLMSNDKPVIELKTNGFMDNPIELNKNSLNKFKNRIVKEIRHKYWSTLLERTELTTTMTGEMLEKYRSKIKEFEDVEFNISNIKQVQIDVVSQLVGGVEESIMKFFNDVTYKYSYYDTGNNIHYYNGWCSNQVGIIGKKVIIPAIGVFNVYTKNFSLPFDTETQISDIHKVFSYFDDGNISDPSTVRNILSSIRNTDTTTNIDFPYFTIDIYKKGTVHIKFKRPDLVKKINIYCGKKLNGLPPCYGKKSYKDMTDREKKIIDEFEGRKSYEETMKNPSMYIMDTRQMLSLTTSK